MESDALDILLRDVLYVLAILVTDEDVGDAGTLGCQYLLLDAAHREDFASESDLARHGYVLAYLAL